MSNSIFNSKFNSKSNSKSNSNSKANSVVRDSLDSTKMSSFDKIMFTGIITMFKTIDWKNKKEYENFLSVAKKLS